MFKTRALAAAALCLSACDAGEPFVIAVGLVDPPPQPIVAGAPLTLTARGTSDGTFDAATLLVFRGDAAFDPTTGLAGDTLAAVRLTVQPGSSSFRDTVTVTIPADAVTTLQGATLYIEYREGNCTSRCLGFVSTSVEIVPAP